MDSFEPSTSQSEPLTPTSIAMASVDSKQKLWESHVRLHTSIISERHPTSNPEAQHRQQPNQKQTHCDEGTISALDAIRSSSNSVQLRVRPTKLPRLNGPWVAENLASKPYYTKPEKDDLPEDHKWRSTDHESLVAVWGWLANGREDIRMRKFYRDGPDDDGIVIRDNVHDKSAAGGVASGYGRDDRPEEVEMKLWKRDVLLRKVAGAYANGVGRRWDNHRMREGETRRMVEVEEVAKHDEEAAFRAHELRRLARLRFQRLG